MADTRVFSVTLIKIHYCEQIDSKKIAHRFIKEHPGRFFQSQPFRLTDVDLHEVINIF